MNFRSAMRTVDMGRVRCQWVCMSRVAWDDDHDVRLSIPHQVLGCEDAIGIVGGMQHSAERQEGRTEDRGT
jgi:hypothetical protein